MSSQTQLVWRVVEVEAPTLLAVAEWLIAGLEAANR